MLRTLGEGLRPPLSAVGVTVTILASCSSPSSSSSLSPPHHALRPGASTGRSRVVGRWPLGAGRIQPDLHDGETVSGSHPPCRATAWGWRGLWAPRGACQALGGC